ncbi:MAG: PAS domain-containing protein [Hahellaceae bacterium]|nr:PAS domain-containing protein [Hahellaceae bacterium]
MTALSDAGIHGLFSRPTGISIPWGQGCASSTLTSVPEQGAAAAETLDLFTRMSAQLTQSYRNLERKVTQLNGELNSEVKQRQAELVEKERLADRLSTLLEILPAGVVVLDGSGVITQCNPAALDLLGEPLEGQRWVDVIDRCFAPRHDDGHEISLKDGRRVSLETRSMKGGPGQLILLKDLTETRALQEQVSRSERLTSLGKMVASLAHQIRTPLSTAMLYAGHLKQAGMSDEMRLNCAEKLMARLVHLERQIRDMLIFAKGETRLAEQLPANRLLTFLKQAAEGPIENAGAEVRWVDQSQGAEVLCNRETLIGACLNLINNSLEASKVAPRLTIGLVRSGEGVLNIVVRDNGPGFTAEQKSRLMEAFYTTKPQGTGLGLSVVQAVTKAHHGKFHISSDKSGTCAVISLPVCKSTWADAAAQTSQVQPV